VSLTIEIGRKIRAPQDEETGVETYTVLWGKQRAVIVWLTVVWLLALCALGAATQINFVVPTAFVLLLLLPGSVLVAWRFLAHPVTAWAKWFETLSGIWTLLVYLSVGIVPLFLG
jgi:4-hydroxybenzoate polyprenyltransferase